MGTHSGGTVSRTEIRRPPLQTDVKFGTLSGVSLHGVAGRGVATVAQVVLARRYVRQRIHHSVANLQQNQRHVKMKQVVPPPLTGA